jgi:hypothetical protein
VFSFYLTGVYELLSNNELLIRFACADNEYLSILEHFVMSSGEKSRFSEFSFVSLQSKKREVVVPKRR